MNTTKRTSFFQENLSLKLISLILAVLLEIYFYSPDNSLTMTLPATVEFRNIPPNTMFLAPRHGEKGIPARVEIRGPRPLVEQVKAAAHKFFIDYPGDSAMSFTGVVDRHQMWLPAGVEILDFSPETIPVQLEKVATKELKVELDLEGAPATGYQLEGYSLFPDSVTVSGPASEVESVKSIHTERVSIAAFSEPKKLELRLQPIGVLSTFSVNAVTGEFKISPIPAQRVLEKANIRILAPYGFAGTVEPSRAKITLVGPQELLDKLAEEGVELIANAAGLEGGRHEVMLSAELPAGVNLLSTEPKKVAVTLVKSKTE